MAVQDAPNPLVHKLTVNPVNIGGEKSGKTKLDEILSNREDMAARRYSIAELEKMALESENEASRLRGEPPKHRTYGGDTMEDEERKRRDQEAREKMMVSAKALIDSGMEPAQVGQMLMGLVPTGTPPTVSQGMTLKDVKEIIDMTTERKEASEIKDLIANLDKRVEDLARGGSTSRVEAQKPLSPMEYAKQQKEYIDALKDLGLIPKPATVTDKGEPIEIVREKYRHEERMAEINNDREYKTTLTSIAGDTFERIGHGIANRFIEEERVGGDGSGEGLDFLICPKEDGGCGAKIFITPETKGPVTCPSCGAVYSRTPEKPAATQ